MANFAISTYVALLFCLNTSQIIAQEIRTNRYPDGVVRYARSSSGPDGHGFWQELERLFNVVIGSEAELPFDRSIAFLAGVAEYASLTELPFVENDVEDMRRFLLEKGGFDEVYVAFGDIVTDDLLNKYMRDKLKRQLGKRDRLLFYYAGHGADNSQVRGYLQFSKAEKGKFYGDHVLSMQEAVGWMDELKDVMHVLLVFDSCASGMAIKPRGENERIQALSRDGSRVVLTAGTAEEQTFEVQGNGVFTRAFLNAFEPVTLERGEDGFLTIEEVFADIKYSVAAFSARYRQSLTPQFWRLPGRKYRGTFVFLNPEAKSQKVQLGSTDKQRLSARSRGTVLATVGSVVVISNLDGNVMVDDEDYGSIQANSATLFNFIPTGERSIRLKTNSGELTRPVLVRHNQSTRVDFEFPAEHVERFVAKTPPAGSGRFEARYRLRKNPKTVSGEELKAMLKAHDFFCATYSWSKGWSNPEGNGAANAFKLSDDGQVVYDAATGLTWQQGGSAEFMTYKAAQSYVGALNGRSFAGYSDWRLPTLEEAMSLMEPRKENDLFIDVVFERRQSWIWTSDKASASRAWVVHFSVGICGLYRVEDIFCVRAVR